MSETHEDPREEKLPRWARLLLAAERHRAGLAERRLAEQLATVEKSPIWYGGYENPIYIPDPYGLESVHFSLTGGDRVGDQIQVMIREYTLEIQGGNTLLIEPKSSNYLRVGLGEIS